MMVITQLSTSWLVDEIIHYGTQNEPLGNNLDGLNIYVSRFIVIFHFQHFECHIFKRRTQMPTLSSGDGVKKEIVNHFPPSFLVECTWYFLHGTRWNITELPAPCCSSVETRQLFSYFSYSFFLFVVKNAWWSEYLWKNGVPQQRTRIDGLWKVKEKISIGQTRAGVGIEVCILLLIFL